MQTLISVFFILAGLFAIGVIGTSLFMLYKLWQRVERLEDNRVSMAIDYVTCGGCGKSLPTRDGFNPAHHACDPRAK